MYEKFLERTGRWIVRHRLWFLIILLWIGLAAFMAIKAPPLTKVGVMDESMFLPSNSNYLQAKEILKEKFPDQVAAGEGILVFYNPNGLSDEDLEYARDLAQWLKSTEAPENVDKVVSIFDQPELKDILVSKDHQAMLMRVTFSTADYDPRTNEAVAAIRAHIRNTAPAHLEIHLTGPAGMGRDMFKVTLESVDKTTLATIILVILVLLLVYRSPVAALVPLISIASAYLVSRGLLGFAAQAGARLSAMLDAMIVVLIFGVGTDYALFLISRFREEVGKTQNRSEAMIRSVAKIGPVITASAATVIIGLLGMMVADFGMTRTNGPAESVGILITLLAALSLTPALLQLFGEHLFWPFHRSLAKQRAGEGLINWRKIGELVTQHPVLVSGVVILLLLLPYPAWAHMKSAFNILSEIPADMDSTRGFRIIREHFSAGEFAPVTVILVSDQDDLLSPDALHDIAQVTDALAQVHGVDKVRSLVRPTGEKESSDFLQVDGQLHMLAAQLQKATAALAQSASTPPQQIPVASLETLRGYLLELGEAYPDVKTRPEYKNALTRVNTLIVYMEKMKEQARVDHQLLDLADRLERMGQSMSPPTSLAQAGPPPAAALTTLRAYLEDLASQYPNIRNTPEYTDAMATLHALEKEIQAMQNRLLVTHQLEEMAQNIDQLAKIQGALSPHSAEQGSPIDALTMVETYLKGLAQAYPDIQDARDYKDALARVDEMKQAFVALQQQTQVAHQLTQLIQRVQQLKEKLATPQALGQSVQGENPVQGLEMIAAYLQELGAAYPQVRSTPQYKDALQRVNKLQTLFQQMAQTSNTPIPPEQRKRLLRAVNQEIDALLQDLQGLQQDFARRPDAVLIPKNLPPTPKMQQALAKLQTSLPALSHDLRELAAAFAQQHPQATYAPKELLNRPEVLQGLKQTRAQLNTLAQDLRELAQRFQGQEVYFIPKHVPVNKEAAQTLANVREQMDMLAKDLEELARQFAGKGTYFIPRSFLKSRPELKNLLDRFLSQDGTATQITVLLEGDPYSMETATIIDRLKGTLIEVIARVGKDNGREYKGYLGGVPVMSHDLKRTVDRDFSKVQAVVIAGVFLVLVILLRSLIAPIYLVLTVLLSYGTTMGLTTFIFQDIKGQEGINYILPIMVFVLLVALGADYNIFLMSRVQEESEKSGNVRDGVRLASAYTGGIITSCGIILAGTFAALAISPFRMLVQMGVAVSLGVLVDTFIVRTLLVPGLATILGRWNWWPRSQ